MILLEDMQGRMLATMDPMVLRTYATATPLGTDDSSAADCDAETTTRARDWCEWGNALKGSNERSGTSNIGAMEGARGCIEVISAPTSGALPTVMLVTVAWQGYHQTIEPTQTCGQNSYGSSGHRRAISVRVSVAFPD